MLVWEALNSYKIDYSSVRAWCALSGSTATPSTLKCRPDEWRVGLAVFSDPLNVFQRRRNLRYGQVAWRRKPARMRPNNQPRNSSARQLQLAVSKSLTSRSSFGTIRGHVRVRLLSQLRRWRGYTNACGGLATLDGGRAPGRATTDSSALREFSRRARRSRTA